jgi:predicted secreted Zn-dependent protease
MRSIAALIALVVAATIVSAQDRIEPTPYPVYPLCDMAFANAAEAAVAAGGAPLEPAASPPVPSAVTSSAPKVGPNPQAVMASPFLDEAIRTCSGIEEFAAAAALHPAALGDTDPLAFLLVRCADPSTDLERYATCASLERTLATPVPTAAPTPTATPAATTGGTAKDKPRATPKPDAQAAKDSPAGPAPAQRGPRRVRLPVISADVPGATRVRYFSIRAENPRQLLRRATKGAGPYCSSHRAVACVSLRTRPRTRYRVDPDTGACRIIDVTVSLQAVVFLPRWTKPRRVYPELVTWWRTVHRHAAWHEGRHIEIQKRHIARLPGMLVGKPCRATKRVLDRWSRTVNAAHDAFDRREKARPLPPYTGPWP